VRNLDQPSKHLRSGWILVLVPCDALHRINSGAAGSIRGQVV
jgi:hypothetical protein